MDRVQRRVDRGKFKESNFREQCWTCEPEDDQQIQQMINLTTEVNLNPDFLDEDANKKVNNSKTHTNEQSIMRHAVAQCTRTCQSK